MPLVWVDAGELCEKHTEDTLDLLQPTPEDIIDEVNRKKDKGAKKDDETEEE